MAIDKDLLDRLLAGRDARELFGSGGLLDELKKALSERILSAELDDHLAHEEALEQGNRRNGTSKKTVLSGTSQVTLAIPRDRAGTFDPKLIGKYQRRFPEFDDKIISMYARGMSVREIRGHLEVLSSTRIFADETTIKILDPGRGKTKQGYFWVAARDDRACGGADPPAVIYQYATGRAKRHADALLGGYRGLVQCDGYNAYKQLAGPARDDATVTLAFCWSHVRRGFYDLAKSGTSPIATEALRRIAALYRIETEIRGKDPAERL